MPCYSFHGATCFRRFYASSLFSLWQRQGKAAPGTHFENVYGENRNAPVGLGVGVARGNRVGVGEGMPVGVGGGVAGGTKVTVGVPVRVGVGVIGGTKLGVPVNVGVSVAGGTEVTVGAGRRGTNSRWPA